MAPRRRPKAEPPAAGITAFAPEPIRRIAEAQSSLSLKQRMLAHHMLQHPEKVGFLSIRELAERAGVSIATVSRLCMQLGYAGYDELGREVQQSLQYEMSTPARFRLLGESAGSRPRSAFERVLDMEVENLLAVRRAAKPSDMQRCIEWLNEAEDVLVVGSMGSAALSEYLAYAVSKVRKSVHLVSSTYDTRSWLGLSNAGPRSLAFLIGFPRYQRSTVEIGRFMKRQGARIVAVTDQHSSPLAALSDIAFPVSVSFSTVVDSFTAPIAFIHALVVEYAEHYRTSVQSHLLDFERYTSDLEIWTKSPSRK